MINRNYQEQINQLKREFAAARAEAHKAEGKMTIEDARNELINATMEYYKVLKIVDATNEDEVETMRKIVTNRVIKNENELKMLEAIIEICK